MKAVRIAALGFGALLLTGFALLGLLFATRGTPLARVVGPGEPSGPPAVGTAEFREAIELYTDAVFRPGHQIEILEDGAGTFPRMLEEMGAARRTLTVQVYYADPGRLATVFRETLEERARAGVEVLYLYDSFGSTLPGSYHDSLRAAGVAVARFRPVRWYSLHKAQLRAHTRAVVIDGRTGYTGGFGLADKWWRPGAEEPEWREVNARFTGPAVRALQAAFATAWVEATGVLLTGEPFFTPPDSAGTAVAALIHSAPSVGSTVAERLLALSIAGAREHLYIANAYFVPDDDFRRLLRQAAARGVDVRVLVPGAGSDIPVVRLAGRATYEELLEAGVRIWEYRPAMMHAKTLTADRSWSFIGTMNFDNRSLALNEEVVLATTDTGVAARMDALFLSDLRAAREIELARFRERPWHAKALELAALMLARVL